MNAGRLNSHGKQYKGCRVPGCEIEKTLLNPPEVLRMNDALREDRARLIGQMLSDGFCHFHLRAFKRGRIDAEGNPIPILCKRCGKPFTTLNPTARICDACQRVRKRDRASRYRGKGRQAHSFPVGLEQRPRPMERYILGDSGNNRLGLATDRLRLEHLLALEKKRRGLAADRLAFVGIANVAEHWWCSQKAVLKSRADEPKFFAAYLSDRIRYADHLGLVKKLPQDDEALLDIGHNLTLAEVQRLSERNENKAPTVTFVSEERIDKNGKSQVFINPDLGEEERKHIEEEAKAKGAEIISVSNLDDPLERGRYAHYSPPESHPAFRWNFPWGDYTVLGIPDGLTKQFVYEYKTTGNRFLLGFLRPVALAQADLYGHFFRRPKKRVQIRILNEDKIETFEDLVDVARAEETLNAFALVEGGRPAHPPKPWKCRHCEFKATCSISQAK